MPGLSVRSPLGELFPPDLPFFKLDKKLTARRFHRKQRAPFSRSRFQRGKPSSRDGFKTRREKTFAAPLCLGSPRIFQEVNIYTLIGSRHGCKGLYRKAEVTQNQTSWSPRLPLPEGTFRGCLIALSTTLAVPTRLTYRNSQWPAQFRFSDPGGERYGR